MRDEEAGAPTGEDEAGQALEVGRPLHRSAHAAHFRQCGEMLADVALQIQDADEVVGRRGRRSVGRYHPRSARCSPYCDSSRPRIASPSP